MTREIRDIPPAPRRVRWRAVLWHWWPVAFAGFVLGVYGGLITLMLFLALGGKPADDELLDRGTNVLVAGTVTEVEGDDGSRPARVSYTFPTGTDTSLSGRSFPQRSGIRVDDEIEIEYVPNQPHKNRVVGGRIWLGPRLHRAFLWFFLAGIACLLVWFVAVLRLRHLLGHGDMAVGTLTDARAVRFVSPSMLHVAYRYRDHHARERTGRHWVRARSALGERVATDPARIAVVHGRAGRGTSRLVMAADFVVERDRRDVERLHPHP